MRKQNKIVLKSIVIALLFAPVYTQAGNPDRAASAGGGQLLINPYARSSGWAYAGSSRVRGLEAMFLNVAGTAFTRKTEAIFSHTNWLGGSAISINAFGLTQRVGETGALGFGIMSISPGQIQITTTDNPEPGQGTFSPSFINMGISYAKGFSDNIYGGMTLKIISEQMSNISARGACLDAGIQYHTGKLDQIHLGIALKNVGPKMSYEGDGLSFEANILSGSQYNNTVSGYTATFQQRASSFELPSLLNIGGAYDFYLGMASKDSSGTKGDHRLTVGANYTSNSFTLDQYSAGVEYGFKQFFMFRAGYMIEKGSTSASTRTNALTGPSAGITLELPFGSEKKSSFGLDYSYRATFPFSGVHSIGIRMNL